MRGRRDCSSLLLQLAAAFFSGQKLRRRGFELRRRFGSQGTAAG